MDCVKKWNIKVNDVYITPSEVFNDILNEFGLDLRKAFDPCPYPASLQDGLEIPWETPCFCNPPFSKVVKWIKKAQEETKRGITTIMVLPWYTQYGNSACKRLLPKEPFMRHTYEFFNPITGEYANMQNGCILIKFSPN